MSEDNFSLLCAFFGIALGILCTAMFYEFKKLRNNKP